MVLEEGVNNTEVDPRYSMSASIVKGKYDRSTDRSRDNIGHYFRNASKPY